MVVNQLIKDCLTCTKERPRFAYISPYLVQTKQIAWDYAKHYSAVIPGVKFNEAELRIDYPNGARLQLLGADNPDRLRGIYLDGVALDEYAQFKPSVFSEIISPTLVDRKGYCIFLGTPKGKNQFWDVYKQALEKSDWLVIVHRASETQLLDPEELERARSLMPEDEYLQEYECSFEAAIKGAFYADEIKYLKKENRICKSVYDKDLPVYTAWDIGISDDTAITFFQLHGKEIRIVDFYSNSGMSLPEYVGVLHGKEYKYSTAYFPWDARIRAMSSGKSTMDVAREHGLDVKIVPNISLQEGIQQVRLVMKRCWFEQDKTKDLIEALTQYRRDYDEDKKAFRASPLHDWTSHPSDSMRYLALAIKEQQPEENIDEAINKFMEKKTFQSQYQPGLTPEEYEREQLEAKQLINL